MLSTDYDRSYDCVRTLQVEMDDGETEESVRSDLQSTDSGYRIERVVGSGSFGVVYKAKCSQSGDTVAVKKVFQDRRYKNRELQIMQGLKHGNIVELKAAYYTPVEASALNPQSGEQPSGTYLNLVMDYLPDTLHRLGRQHALSRTQIPIEAIRKYTRNIFAGLSYLHDQGVAHRDIKPQNMLINSVTCDLKICDFGSAKRLRYGEPNVAYICSRYYRAPELVFGSTDYSCLVDVWSAGCVAAELLLGRPLFPGQSSADQLVEIIKILGTPTKNQILAMNPNAAEYKFPTVQAVKWSHILKTNDESVASFFESVIRYDPNQRHPAGKALEHPFLDDKENGMFEISIVKRTLSASTADSYAD